MARSKRLSPILRLAERKEKNAVQIMARARQRLHYYEEKRDELRSYLDEYKLTMTDRQANTMTANQLREYQVFIHQLNEGISLLTEKIEGQKQLKLRDERQWISAKQNTDALDKLIIKLRWMERKFVSNHEANEIDEQSSQKHKSNL